MVADPVRTGCGHSLGGRVAFAAAWCGTGALLCALVPALRPLAVVLGGSALVLAAVSVRVARLRGTDRVFVLIALAMVLLSGVGVVATEVAFGAAAPGEALVLGVTAPREAVAGATLPGRDLAVNVGKVVLSVDRFGDSQATVPVVMTNLSDRARAVDIEFEALTAKGRHLTYDSAFVPALGPGQSVSVSVFTIVNQQLAPKLLKAQFRVVRAVWYG